MRCCEGVLSGRVWRREGVGACEPIGGLCRDCEASQASLMRVRAEVSRGGILGYRPKSVSVIVPDPSHTKDNHLIA